MKMSKIRFGCYFMIILVAVMIAMAPVAYGKERCQTDRAIVQKFALRQARHLVRTGQYREIKFANNVDSTGSISGRGSVSPTATSGVTLSVVSFGQFNGDVSIGSKDTIIINYAGDPTVLGTCQLRKFFLVNGVFTQVAQIDNQPTKGTWVDTKGAGDPGVINYYQVDCQTLADPSVAYVQYTTVKSVDPTKAPALTLTQSGVTTTDQATVVAGQSFGLGYAMNFGGTQSKSALAYLIQSDGSTLKIDVVGWTKDQYGRLIGIYATGTRTIILQSGQYNLLLVSDHTSETSNDYHKYLGSVLITSR